MACMGRVLKINQCNAVRQDMLAERFKGLLQAEAWNKLWDLVAHHLISEMGLSDITKAG